MSVPAISTTPPSASKPSPFHEPRRFFEAVLTKQLTLPKASELTLRLRQQLPHLMRRDIDGRSALHLLEVFFRIGATAFGVWLALSHKLYWLLPILWIVQGVNYFAAASFMHDLVHSSAFRSRVLNQLVAQLLAPLLLARYSAFKDAHLLHHELNSSGQDPKIGKVANAKYSVLPYILRFIYNRIYKPGSVTLQRFVVFLVITVAVFPLLHANNEFSPLRRPRTWQAWLETVALVAMWSAAVYFLGAATTALIFFVPLLFAYPLIAIVFLTHQHERSVSPVQNHPDEYELMIFNIRDITMGKTLDRLGFYFARHHIAHHMFPGLPFHRLKEASAFIERECADYLLPVVPFSLDYMRTGMVPFTLAMVRVQIAGREYEVMPGFVQS